MPNNALEASELDLPVRIGPYVVVGELGRGGMGVVYKAEHTETRQRVALKTVTGVDGARLAFLRREIDALRRIQHPDVVRIVDSGDWGGIPYYAMELLEGATLRSLNHSIWASVERSTVRLSVPRSSEGAPTIAAETHLEEQPLEQVPQERTPRPLAAGGELPRVLGLVRRLCEPLAALHARGLVHRDLKPENVFIRSDGTPVLVDLGVASRFGGAGAREALEIGGLVIGSLAYMAPEQTRGELVDARADLYALGCMLFECVTGQQPFSAPTSAALIHAHQFQAPRPASELVDGVPPGLDDLIGALLAKHPSDRVGYAADVARALEALGAPGAGGAAPPISPATYVYRPRLAGRAEALKTLERAFVDGAQGAGGLLYVGGESGVGKTRVVMEAATLAALRHRTRVLTGECLAVGVGDLGSETAVKAAPLHPFRSILEAIADRCRAGGPAETDELLGARGKVLAPYDPALASLPGQDAYPEPLPMPAQAARDRVVRALRDTLVGYARRAPLLLVLDDLQWADELTLGFLESLDPAELQREPLLLLGTYRVEERSQGLDRLLARDGARRLTLAPLQEAETASMAEDMLATHPLPRSLGGRLHRLSGGNPFFVSEYVRSIVDDGLVRRGPDGRWDLSEGVVSSLPEVGTLSDLVGRRLRLLRPATLAALQQAAVLGRDLDLDTFGATLGAGVDLAEIVEELAARAIVELGAGSVVRFAHDKLREHTYAAVPPAARAELHARAARAIAARWAGTPDEALYYPALAHHLTMAEDVEGALRYLELAAEQSLELGSYHDAIGYLERAHRLAGDGAVPASRRARWDRRVGEASFALGDLPGSERHFSEGMERLGVRVPRTAGARARALLAGLAQQSARLLGLSPKVEVPEAHRQAVEEIAQSAADLAFHYYFVNDVGGQLVMSLIAANEAERPTVEVPVPGPYIWLGYTSGLMRLHGLAHRYFEKARRNAELSKNRADYCFSLSLEAVYFVGYPRWADARDRTGRCAALLRDYDDPQRFELNRVVEAQVDYYTGATDASDDGFAQLLRSAARRANAQHTGWAEYGAGRSAICRGRPGEGLALLDQAAAHLATTQDRASEMMALAWGAAALAWTGRWEDAWRRARETLRRLQGVAPAVVFTLDAYAMTADVLLDLLDRRFVPEGGREADVSKAAAQAVQELFKFAMVFPFGGPALARARARLAAGRGSVGRAARLLRQSLELAERFEMPGEAATTHLASARLEAGTAPGRASAARAHAAFERLGWAARAEQARTFLA